MCQRRRGGVKFKLNKETRRHRLLTKSKPVDCICRDVGAEGRPLVAGVLLKTLEAGGTGELGGVAAGGGRWSGTVSPRRCLRNLLSSTSSRLL